MKVSARSTPTVTPNTPGRQKRSPEEDSIEPSPRSAHKEPPKPLLLTFINTSNQKRAVWPYPVSKEAILSTLLESQTAKQYEDIFHEGSELLKGNKGHIAIAYFSALLTYIERSEEAERQKTDDLFKYQILAYLIACHTQADYNHHASGLSWDPQENAWGIKSCNEAFKILVENYLVLQKKDHYFVFFCHYLLLVRPGSYPMLLAHAKKLHAQKDDEKYRNVISYLKNFEKTDGL